LEWLKDQFYNVNIIGDILIVVVTVAMSKRNTKKEVEELKQAIKKSGEE
jgi:sensor domain CHASE-containing protein